MINEEINNVKKAEDQNGSEIEVALYLVFHDFNLSN